MGVVMGAARDMELLSQYLGNKVEFVQSGGGNTSVKIDVSQMLVKASGVQLRHVTSAQGFVQIDYCKYREILNKRLNDCTEEEYGQIGIQCISSPTELKPSIELCFHTLMKQSHILHSHSVFLNVLLCSNEGIEILKKLVPHALIIPYVTPGKNLAKTIIQCIDHTSKQAEVIFLQNHGVIVSGNSVSDCIDRHESLNIIIQNELSLPAFDLIESDEAVDSSVLFPDQAVYLHSDTIKNAAQYILREIKRAHFTPHFLCSSDVDYLKSMESEKYRSKMGLK